MSSPFHHLASHLPASLLGAFLLLSGCGSTPEPQTQIQTGGPAAPGFQGQPVGLADPDPDRLRADLYARARELEDQGFKSEAIATYTEVLAEFGDYEDAQARRQQLADVLGMSLPELLIPERPQAASAPTLETADTAESLEPRLPPNPSALERESLWVEMYERARRYERAHRYLTAIDVYDELLKGRGSYKDAALRRTTLIKLQRLAEQLYARGVAAETDEEALDNFEQIEIFWPEFRDISERLQNLRDL